MMTGAVSMAVLLWHAVYLFTAGCTGRYRLVGSTVPPPESGNVWCYEACPHAHIIIITPHHHDAALYTIQY